jgi:hypothetical protein
MLFMKTYCPGMVGVKSNPGSSLTTVTFHITPRGKNKSKEKLKMVLN